jgi:cytidylate kinase
VTSSHAIPVIAIDGPVASGKGTVARAVAAALGFHLLDSGAIYRAFALAIMNRNVNTSDFNSLERQAKKLSLEFRGESVWLDGVDATVLIRSEAVGMLASRLSAVAEVRAALMDRQRAFAQAPGLVADGRDMGTVVFPNATMKIYLTATAETRAARRFGQLQKQRAREETNNATLTIADNAAKHLNQKGNSPIISDSLERVIEQIQQRDLQDKSRSISPLKPAADAIVIDNALHGPHQTIDVVLSLWDLRQR